MDTRDIDTSSANNKKVDSLSKRETQELQMMMGELNSAPSLNSDQVDTVLAQRSKAMDYQHADNQRLLDMQETKLSNQQHMLLGTAVFVLILVPLVGYFDASNVSQVLQLLFAFIGGGGFGLYYGQQSGKNDDS